MPIDTGIYQNYLRPPKSVAEYDAEAQTRQSNALALALQRGQLAKMQQGMADDAALREAAKGFGTDTGANYNALLKVNPGAAAAYQKATLDAEETRAKTKQASAHADLFGVEAAQKALATHRDMLNGVNDPQSAAQWVQANYADPIIGPFLSKSAPVEAALARIPQDPAGFQQWKLQNGLGLEQQLKMTMQAQQQAETAQHNRATEATARGQLGVAQAHVGVARERLALDKAAPKGQIVQTDQGTMLVDPRTGEAKAVTDATGAALTKPLKDVPAAAAKTIIENQQAITNIDTAIDAIKKYPAALGPTNMIPGAQTVRQYTDPKGVDVRAIVADIGSLKLHDRSGAAVSASEFPRLAPFIPSASDSPEAAIKKLQNFKRVYQQETELYAQTYGKEQGYKPSPVAAPKSAVVNFADLK